MATVPFLAILALVTLIIVVGAGIWQFRRVRRSQAIRGERPGGIAGPSP
jgi:cytochrome oxidase assembly protein ShyY1